jgi:hypothetical protein
MISCSVHAKLFFGVREGAYSKPVEVTSKKMGR